MHFFNTILLSLLVPIAKASAASSAPPRKAGPKARLAFFARRHASWDERFDLYPVLRTAPVPAP